MIEDLFTSLYYKKSTKKLRSAIDTDVDSVFKSPDLKGEMRNLRTVISKNNEMVKEVELRYTEYKNAIAMNLAAYICKNRSKFMYFLLTLWIKLKAFIWIIFWYIKS